MRRRIQIAASAALTLIVAAYEAHAQLRVPSAAADPAASEIVGAFFTPAGKESLKRGGFEMP
jgi:hypothetical protein